ncbi:MAG: methyltransferase domain-containing protein, partial [Chitinophagaceae bacterium]
KEHYDGVAKMAKQKRTRLELQTLPILNANNLIKKTMLSHVPIVSGARILDLCCGRGADIFKYNELHPSFVHFVDISSESLFGKEGASDRFNAAKDIQYKAEFTCADCFEPLTIHDTFDLVVCHFALHYAFDEKRRFETFMSNVASMMKPGAFFFATFPPAPTILSHCESGIFKNEVMTIEPISLINQSVYGQKYLFTLQHAITRCPEYLVPLSLFEDIVVKKHHIRPILHDTFINAAKIMNIPLPNEVMTRKSFYEVVDLYHAFIGQTTNISSDLDQFLENSKVRFCDTQIFHSCHSVISLCFLHCS